MKEQMNVLLRTNSSGMDKLGAFAFPGVLKIYSACCIIIATIRKPDDEDFFNE
jgi:hypothetical protein